MKIKLLYITLCFSFFIPTVKAQTDSTQLDSSVPLKGIIRDYSNNTPLAYANIAIQNSSKGSISNEKGFFSIDITGLTFEDSLSFQYIGYKTETLSLRQLSRSQTIFLKEYIQNLNQVFVFGNPLNAKDIIKKVLENKDVNYAGGPIKSQTFIRKKSLSNIDHFQLNYKKSSFSELDETFIASIPKTIPRHSTSYTDFLGHVYYANNKKDSFQYKISAIKAVSLQDKDVADVDQLESVFENLAINTQEKEYWKVKSGIFGSKIDLNVADTSKEKKGTKMAYFQYYYGEQLKYSTLENEDEWEFLYSPSKYNYTLLGGTQVNGEDVYIIDFKPNRKGNFVGRVYISILNYALIKADYEYDEGKYGTNVNLLGIGYTENVFNASILFERDADVYRLKYCAKKKGEKVRIDRNISFIKKRERFLIDKTLKEVKVGLDISISTIESFEILVLTRSQITNQQYNAFTQQEFIEIVYVDQFNDQLWKGLSIIEPTQQMREYKKME